MLTWICPMCGRECQPDEMECKGCNPVASRASEVETTLTRAAQPVAGVANSLAQAGTIAVMEPPVAPESVVLPPTPIVEPPKPPAIRLPDPPRANFEEFPAPEVASDFNSLAQIRAALANHFGTHTPPVAPEPVLATADIPLEPIRELPTRSEEPAVVDLVAETVSPAVPELRPESSFAQEAERFAEPVPSPLSRLAGALSKAEPLLAQPLPEEDTIEELPSVELVGTKVQSPELIAFPAAEPALPEPVGATVAPQVLEDEVVAPTLEPLAAAEILRSTDTPFFDPTPTPSQPAAIEETAAVEPAQDRDTEWPLGERENALLGSGSSLSRFEDRDQRSWHDALAESWEGANQKTVQLPAFQPSQDFQSWQDVAQPDPLPSAPEPVALASAVLPPAIQEVPPAIAEPVIEPTATADEQPDVTTTPENPVPFAAASDPEVDALAETGQFHAFFETPAEPEDSDDTELVSWEESLASEENQQVAEAPAADPLPVVEPEPAPLPSFSFSSVSDIDTLELVDPLRAPTRDTNILPSPTATDTNAPAPSPAGALPGSDDESDDHWSRSLELADPMGHTLQVPQVNLYSNSPAVQPPVWETPVVEPPPAPGPNLFAAEPLPTFTPALTQVPVVEPPLQASTPGEPLFGVPVSEQAPPLLENWGHRAFPTESEPPVIPNFAAVGSILKEPTALNLPPDHWSLQPADGEPALPASLTVPPPVAAEPSRPDMAQIMPQYTPEPEAEPAPPVPPPPAARTPGIPVTETKKRSNFGTLGLVALMIVALAGLGIFAISQLNRGTADTANLLPSAAIPTNTHQLSKDLEIVGFRITPGPGITGKVGFVVVNHSNKKISNLTVRVIVKSLTANGQPEQVTQFRVKIPDIEPLGSCDVVARETENVRINTAVDASSWQKLRPEFQVESADIQ